MNMSGQWRQSVTAPVRNGQRHLLATALLESPASRNTVAEVLVTTLPQTALAPPQPAAVMAQYGRLCTRSTRACA